MKIHEYQAKELFREYGIPTASDIAVSTAEEAVRAAEKLGLPAVLKAQVHVGGRGKAGGIKLVETMDQVATTAEAILSMSIKGLPVRKLLVASAVNIKKEVYLSLLIDRGASKVVFIGCSEGGVEIEQTAKTSPEKILRFETPVSSLGALKEEECLPFARKLFPDAGQAGAAARIMAAMGRMFVERDCSLIEINPLVVDENGTVIALDAKVLLDDNALFRQPKNLELREEDPEETAARNGHLSFVRLDGEIGCMVNGAGLAMATMDIVKHFGGSPANFLDVGGSSDPKKVVDGFKLILEDKSVKVIFLNIFGGITRCDDIVKGILAAREQFDVRVPIVIRMAGTNEAEGRALLEGTDMMVADSLEEGAKTVVEIGKSR
ncbi:MAG: ADP-forming succinate--CoA ligase subunit beta [Armatimonadetes bacterium]|nr:ADP-forming succinate--CoA ligase subunit beta [Armatimonadota bacterium]